LESFGDNNMKIWLDFRILYYWQWYE